MISELPPFTENIDNLLLVPFIEKILIYRSFLCLYNIILMYADIQGFIILQ